MSSCREHAVSVGRQSNRHLSKFEYPFAPRWYHIAPFSDDGSQDLVAARLAILAGAAASPLLVGPREGRRVCEASQVGDRL